MLAERLGYLMAGVSFTIIYTATIAFFAGFVFIIIGMVYFFGAAIML